MKNIKISGFSDEIDSDINIQFQVLKKLGIEYFEPRGINGKNISEISDEELLELKNDMNEFGIKASSIGSPIGKINITDDFEKHLEKFKRVVYIAKQLGTQYIRIFSFFIPEGEVAENFRDEVMLRMKRMAQIAEENDIILLHENEKDIYGDTAKRCVDVFKTVNSPNLRAVFDPANFVQVGQKTYPDAYQMMMPYIEYMHIKDACGDVIVPAGKGDGHIEEILRALYANGYQGFLSLEPHLGSFEGLAALELDDKMLKLPKSGEGTFTLAFDELKKVLDKIN